MIAKEIGLNCIEFILDFSEVKHNPLTNKIGAQVKTICGDYLLEQPLHSTDNEVTERNLSILQKLLSAVDNGARISDINIKDRTFKKGSVI